MFVLLIDNIETQAQLKAPIFYQKKQLSFSLKGTSEELQDFEIKWSTEYPWAYGAVVTRLSETEYSFWRALSCD